MSGEDQDLIPRVDLPDTTEPGNHMGEVTEATQLIGIIGRAASDPTCDVEKMERLFDLREKIRAEQAELEYSRAFAALQSELPPIVECKGIPDASGRMKYHYAPYADIMKVLRPLLDKHGFSTSRSQTADDKTTTVYLTVRHVGGHKEVSPYTVRNGSGPPKSGAEQASGSSGSFAARYALRDAFDLVFTGEYPPESEAKLGSPISPEDAAILRERVQAAGRDEVKFLKFAGVDNIIQPVMNDHYEKILSGRMASLDAALRSVEK